MADGKNGRTMKEQQFGRKKRDAVTSNTSVPKWFVVNGDKVEALKMGYENWPNSIFLGQYCFFSAPDLFLMAKKNGNYSQSTHPSNIKGAFF